MRVLEHLDRAKRPLVSFEIIPPLRGGTARSVFQLIEDLLPYEPPFIDASDVCCWRIPRPKDEWLEYST